jgi:small nuclear ribonucleoprotein (snRNP)-like protein
MIYKDKLNFFINKKIRIHTKHNTWMEGKLCGFDQFMNLSLKDLELFSESKRQKLGLSLLRGSVILSIQPLE